MPTLIKSFTSVGGRVVNPDGFRAVRPPRAKLTTLPFEAQQLRAVRYPDSTLPASPVAPILREDEEEETTSEPVTEIIEVMFPFGPQDIQHQNLSGNTVEIARPGKKPILFLESPRLRSVSFKAVLAHKESGGTLPVVQLLEQLETIAANAYPCTFTYGLTSLAYNVVLTRFSFDVTYRNNAGEPVRAEVDLQLTESPLFSQEIEELKAVVREPKVPTGVYVKPEDDVVDPPPLGTSLNGNDLLDDLPSVEINRIQSGLPGASIKYVNALHPTGSRITNSDMQDILTAEVVLG